MEAADLLSLAEAADLQDLREHWDPLVQVEPAVLLAKVAAAADRRDLRVLQVLLARVEAG